MALLYDIAKNSEAMLRRNLNNIQLHGFAGLFSSEINSDNGCVGTDE
jgi:hypothetical protein